MIKLNDNFKADWDGRQWILYEAYLGKDAKGIDKNQTRSSYHSTLRQACKKVVDASVVGCGDAVAVIAAMDKAGWVLEGQSSGYLPQLQQKET